MLRQCGHNFGRGKWNMQEKAHPVVMAALAQCIRDGDQMVIMDPDQIVFRDDLFELSRKTIINPEISAEVPGRELCEIEPVMQDWPQYSVGNAAVIFVKVLVRQS